MLSQAKIQATNKSYYLSLGNEDYYTEKGNLSGRWLGSGSLHFQLEKESIKNDDVAFKNLIDGKDPTGKEVIRKSGSTVRIYRSKVTGEITKKSNPVCGIDNTFSAPKDVSLLWALGDKETRSTVLKVHKAAVKEAVDYIDRQVYTRSHSRNPDGTRTMSWHEAKGTFAAFDHFTSRELDPQLHSHVVLLNAVVRADGKGQGAVDADRIFVARFMAGQLYLNHLRRELEAELGVTTFDRKFSDEKGVSFGINGVTQSQREKFSLRSMQIQKEITADMTGKEINAIALKTRRAKNEPPRLDLLEREWRVRAKALGFDLNKILHRDEQAHFSTSPEEKEVIGKRIVRKVLEKPLQKATNKLTESADKALNKLSRFDKTLTTEEEKLFRNVAQSLARRIDYQYEKRDRELEKKEQYETQKSKLTKEKLAESYSPEEAEKIHKQFYPRPTFNKRAINNPNIGTIKKGVVEEAFLQHNYHLSAEEAEELAEKFRSQYTVELEAKQEPSTNRRKKKAAVHDHDSYKRTVQKRYVYALNLDCQELARQQTTREQVVAGIADLNNRYKTLRSAAKGYYYQMKVRNFESRLKWYYATGQVSRKKYIQLRDKKYLEYGSFKLEILRGFGVLSGKQVRHAKRYKKWKDNPYMMVRKLEKEGAVTAEEATKIAHALYGHLNVVKELATERKDQEAISKFNAHQKEERRGR